MKTIINFEFDPDELKAEIENADSLKDNPKFFKQVSKVAEAKAKLGEAQDALKSIEAIAKLAINDRAKSLYGKNWKAVAGDGYKITRTETGSVYEVVDTDKAEKFIKVEVKPDTDKILDFIKANNELPEGVAFNDNRGESITIKVQ